MNFDNDEKVMEIMIKIENCSVEERERLRGIVISKFSDIYFKNYFGF